MKNTHSVHVIQNRDGKDSV